MAMTERQLIQGAFTRAAGRSSAVHFVAVSDGGYAVYAVGSSREVDQAYRVTVAPDGTFRCTCPSELRPACWHRAAVAQVRASRLASGRSADGPAPGQRAVVERTRPTAPRRLPPREIDEEF